MAETPMLAVRKAEERGHANHGWLDSYHSFSFADYYDPEHMGYGPLRVINEDRVQAGSGFGTHGHRDMEIISYVLEGALGHQDSMGNGSSIVPGDVQRMSAGTGVRHSEFNHSKTGVTHFLQIWIEPKITGLRPSYEQKHFPAAEKRGQLRLIVSPDGREGSVTIQQDAFVYSALLDGKDTIAHRLVPARRAYVHIACGTVKVNGVDLKGGDGVRIAGESKLEFSGAQQAELLLFDLP